MNDNSPAKLTRSVKLGYAVGELGIALYVGVTMMFFLFYLTDARRISPFWSGMVLLVPRLLDAVFDPLVGTISDRTRSRLGRRRPYLLVGSIAYGAAFFGFLAMPDFQSQALRIAYGILAYLAASLAYSFMAVPYSAMTAEMTLDYRERTELVAYRSMAARLGIVGAGLFTPLLYATQPTLAKGFWLVGLVFGAFMTASGLVTFFTTRGAPHVRHVVRTVNLKDEVNAIVCNRPFACSSCFSVKTLRSAPARQPSSTFWPM